MENTQDLKVQESIDKIKQDTQEFTEKSNVEELIKDNKIEFEINGIKYKVTKPTFSQKLKVSEARQKKYISLLKNSEYLLEKDLIEIYKGRGIDIKELDTKYNALEAKKKDLALRLGKGITESKSKEELDALKNEIEKIMVSQQDIVLEKIIYLDSSIEAQVNVFSYTYLGYLITEKLIIGEGENKDQWIKAWDSYEQFINEDEKLVNNIVGYSSFLSKNDFIA